MLWLIGSCVNPDRARYSCRFDIDLPGLAQMRRNRARDASKHQRDPTKARAFDCATSFGCLFRLEPSEDINLNLLRMLNHPGVRRGAVIDGLVFASMLVVWSVIEWRSPGARNADTGAMALLGPVMFLLYLWLGAALALGSSLLGAFAGYWAARTRNPFMGAVAGLLAGIVAAGLLAVLFPANAGEVSLVASWFVKLKWLAPPAIVAGVTVGMTELQRPT